MTRIRHLSSALLVLATLWPARAQAVRLKELVDVQGFRPNPLSGLGVVVGLDGTGDDMSSMVTRRPLAAMLRHLGSAIDPNEILVRDVALVMVTATLPPYVRPGMKIDVTVSALGTARSLQGGTLVATPLKGADGETYALAQGSLEVGGYTVEGVSGSTVGKNHVNVGLIPGGGVVEREVTHQLPEDRIVLQVREPDFTTASRIAAAVNKALGAGMASVRDPGAVTVALKGEYKDRFVDLVAKLESIDTVPDVPARVIIDERTGTIVVGASVSLGPAAIAHGGLTIKVAERQNVSQPGALAQGQTAVTPESAVDAHESAGKVQALPHASTVGDVVNALNALGVKPRDLVTIFQALKAAGALQAEIQVL